MKHYYIINGNEYGFYITTKKNFIHLENAESYFNDVKYDDFCCYLVAVDNNGEEEIILTFYNI